MRLQRSGQGYSTLGPTTVRSAQAVIADRKNAASMAANAEEMSGTASMATPAQHDVEALREKKASASRWRLSAGRETSASGPRPAIDRRPGAPGGARESRSVLVRFLLCRRRHDSRELQQRVRLDMGAHLSTTTRRRYDGWMVIQLGWVRGRHRAKCASRSGLAVWPRQPPRGPTRG